MKSWVVSITVVFGLVVVLSSAQAQTVLHFGTVTFDSNQPPSNPANTTQTAIKLHSIRSLGAVFEFPRAASGELDGLCRVGRIFSSGESCENLNRRRDMEMYSSLSLSEFVDIQYDQGDAFGDKDDHLFIDIPADARMSTRFAPKTSSGDDRAVRIDRIWLAPYFNNQFQNTELPDSAPRDLTVYIYTDQGGRPSKLLFSKIIDDPRSFEAVTNFTLNFFELDLSDEGIGVLPDIVHIAYGNAGSDENLLIIGPAPYKTEDVSHLYRNNRWSSLWSLVTTDQRRRFNETVIPIRARFSLEGTAAPLQFEQTVTDQSFPRGQFIIPLVLPRATGGALPISYSLTPTLPTGLSFDSSTRTISGLPMEATASPVTYTYIATDANGDEVSLQFNIDVHSTVDGTEFVDIRYDSGEVAAGVSNGGDPLFVTIKRVSRMSTRFAPKASRDNREVRIDRIWLAPYFDNQFRNTELPDSAPRDLTVYIHEDQEGRPGDVLFSKVIEDPRSFAGATDATLNFFELDLSNDRIGALPDVVHIAYGDAGSDQNNVVIAPSPYATQDVSHLYLKDEDDGTWSSLWNVVTSNDIRLFNETVIPIRARFSLVATSTSVEFMEKTLPELFVVHGNYPNPFRQSTYLQFDLPTPARVTVDVIDMVGRRVLTVSPVEMAAGREQQIVLDGQSLPPGHYLYRMVMSSAEGSSMQTGHFVRLR